MQPERPVPPLSARFVALCYHPQFLWWVGHVIMVVCSFQYFHKLVVFDEDRRHLVYRVAYTGAILSYSVLLYKQYGRHQVLDRLGDIIRDENVFYLFLAWMWWWNDPIAVTLVPYGTFSLFHMLTYLRGNVIPTLVPTIPPNVAAFPPSQPNHVAQLLADTSKFILAWVQRWYHLAMTFVSYMEVVAISAMLLWNVITGYVPFRMLFVYGMFLHVRYQTSMYTKTVVYDVGQKLGINLPPPPADRSPSPQAAGPSLTSRLSTPSPSSSSGRSFGGPPMPSSGGRPSSRAPSSSIGRTQSSSIGRTPSPPAGPSADPLSRPAGPSRPVAPNESADQV